MLRKVRDLFVSYNQRAGGRTLTQSMLLGFARGLDLRLPIGLEGSVYRGSSHSGETKGFSGDLVDRSCASETAPLAVAHNLFQSLQFI